MRVTVAPEIWALMFGFPLCLSWPEWGLAQEMSVIERLIAEQYPCKDLEGTQLGIPFDISVLQDVSLDGAEISLREDKVSATFAGRLACRTSDNAVLSSDAAASVQMSASLSLADCSIGALEVVLSEFGGDFGPILEVLAPVLEVVLEEAARGSLVQACQDFGAS
ncbi:hypothetical protein [Rubellimicrobium roseum]|uniref:Uncharacterized protein n=1 Tax=Rubellimicrobium roseum TaxID=687525 RepID=A0A5C4N562_9RHOB|nr:hypothetical protein [Rubellimicrobium roseum]TNC64003.1 hypothetical protein FHG71_18880 [Rubellimicrobium roseum]